MSPLLFATGRATGCEEQLSFRTSPNGKEIGGVKLTGRIRSFDKYSVVLETNNQEQLIFKHAISTVVMGRVTHAPFAAHGEGKPTAVAAPVAVAPVTASGTEG
jgi:host factor-I protein